MRESNVRDSASAVATAFPGKFGLSVDALPRWYSALQADERLACCSSSSKILLIWRYHEPFRR